MNAGQPDRQAFLCQVGADPTSCSNKGSHADQRYSFVGSLSYTPISPGWSVCTQPTATPPSGNAAMVTSRRSPANAATTTGLGHSAGAGGDDVTRTMSPSSQAICSRPSAVRRNARPAPERDDLNDCLRQRPVELAAITVFHLLVAVNPRQMRQPVGRCRQAGSDRLGLRTVGNIDRERPAGPTLLAQEDVEHAAGVFPCGRAILPRQVDRAVGGGGKRRGLAARIRHRLAVPILAVPMPRHRSSSNPVSCPSRPRPGHRPRRRPVPGKRRGRRCGKC